MSWTFSKKQTQLALSKGIFPSHLLPKRLNEELVIRNSKIYYKGYIVINQLIINQLYKLAHKNKGIRTFSMCN